VRLFCCAARGRTAARTRPVATSFLFAETRAGSAVAVAPAPASASATATGPSEASPRATRARPCTAHARSSSGTDRSHRCGHGALGCCGRRVLRLQLQREFPRLPLQLAEHVDQRRFDRGQELAAAAVVLHSGLYRRVHGALRPTGTVAPKCGSRTGPAATLRPPWRRGCRPRPLTPTANRRSPPA